MNAHKKREIYLTSYNPLFHLSTNCIPSLISSLFSFSTFWTAADDVCHPITSFPVGFLLQSRHLPPIYIYIYFRHGNPSSVSPMATYSYTSQYTSQRSVAMVLALASAIVLSPLYARRKSDARYNETKWSSGFVLPMVLAGLIIAIRTTSSCSSMSAHGGGRASIIPSPDPSWVLRIGSSSWGLAGVLVMLMLVLSWQESVQDFFWR